MGNHEKVNILMVDDQPAKLLSYEVMLGGLGENLIKANSALTHPLPVDIPSFENEGRIGQDTGRSDLVDRRIEVERRGSDRRIDAPRNRNDTFHGRAGQRLVASRCRRQPQRCYGCSDRGQANDAARARHGVAFRTSLFSTVPVSPCTFAPSESCQPPAMVKFALNR